MASKLDKDDYVYNIEIYLCLWHPWMLRARNTAPVRKNPNPPPASPKESLLELEWVKNENLKMELDVPKKSKVRHTSSHKL